MELWGNVGRELCSMAVLLWLAIQDKRNLGVTRAGLIVTSGVLLVVGCFGTASWQSRLGGAAVGAILLLFGYFSKEAIGLADGIVVLVCGLSFGLYETVAFCFFAAVYAGCFSIVLLIAGRVGKKSRIPFLPFLLLGYITMRVLVNTV